MATKKNDLFEQEKQAQEMSEKSAQPDGMELGTPGTDTADGLSANGLVGGDAELNELLINMDQELSGEDALQDTDQPGFSDKEFGNVANVGSITAADDTNATDYSSAMDSGQNISESENISSADVPPVKPKRASRRRKTSDSETTDTETPQSEYTEPPVSEESDAESDFPTAEDFDTEQDNPATEDSLPADVPATKEASAPLPNVSPAASRQSPIRSNAPVLTIRSREDVITESEQEDITWHEIRNAYRTRRILTGKLGGIEQTDNHKTIAIVDYKGFRIIIPLKEMMFQLPRTGSEQEYSEMMLRQNKILNNMLGADIDFIVRGIDSKTYSVVASRREAMLRKRQLFYLDTDPSGAYRIYEGRIVQARVIAVAEKVIRVEVFGVETSIMARDLAWDWIGDAHERFSVGDQVLVRVLSIRRDSIEEISIKADVKSVSQNTNHDNLKKCQIQSKYAGKVTDVHKGVVYVRLANGVNAVAHSCYDYRTPGKKDDVSFAVTRIDEERGVAVGIITRIIRQNL